jgi:hypothetical protein
MHIDMILGYLWSPDIALDYLLFLYRLIHKEITLGYLWSLIDTHIQI